MTETITAIGGRPAEATADEVAVSVEIEPHGIPGTEGAPAGAIRREIDFEGFRKAFWIPSATRDSDIHAGFIGAVDVRVEGIYDFAVQTSGTFRVHLDGAVLVSGPLRYSPSLPEYHRQKIQLSEGIHTFAIHAHGEGLMTRTAAALPNFVWARLSHGITPLEINWRGRELDEFQPTGLRVSPLLGWVEWQRTPWKMDWKAEDPTAEPWADVVETAGLSDVIGATTTPSELPLPLWPVIKPTVISSGVFRDTFVGYEFDDLASQFMLADPSPSESDDPDGIWIRFDLGKIRIGAMNFTVDSDSPAEVTICYSERLTPEGRPSPVVALSAGPTRMIQHYTVAPGCSEISPLQSLGGRFVEVRIRTTGRASLSHERFVERDMLGTPRGSFLTDDPMLNAIWQTGIETLRSSAEDSLVDSVRERGEWVGDVVSSALHILGAGWGDYRLVRRALLHAAAGARPDGLVAGCGPGEIIYLGTYAAQWVTACLDVAIAEGSPSILDELEEPGRANMVALVSSIAGDGSHTLPWGFVDWGYGIPRNQPDLAVLLHVVKAINSWIRWQELLGRTEDLDTWIAQRERLTEISNRWLSSTTSPYHSVTLAASAGLITDIEAADPVLGHIRAGFPFDRSARRLRAPTEVNRAAVTPYFTNYSMGILLRAGLGRDVSNLWSRGWGWMLDRGATTWYEVFDERWSQCHYWSGAPTWQMSRFGLGLHPMLEADGSHVELRVNSLGLRWASGSVHVPGADFVDVEWSISPEGTMHYTLRTEREFHLVQGGIRRLLTPGKHDFKLTARADSDIYE